MTIDLDLPDEDPKDTPDSRDIHLSWDTWAHVEEVQLPNPWYKRVWWWLHDHTMEIAIVAMVLFLCLVVYAAIEDANRPRTESGMRVYEDEETGCQYLGRDGALTPRLDAEGKQICKQICEQ